MPKYYCDYCDTYLTHDSPSVRKTHCTGRKHKDNVKFYYQKWMEEQAQHLIDATTAAFKAGKIANNPFAQAAKGVAIPPPAQLQMGQRPPGSQGPPGKICIKINIFVVIICKVKSWFLRNFIIQLHAGYRSSISMFFFFLWIISY